MKTIVLTLPYPISSNRYWATRVVKSKQTGKPMAMTYVTPDAVAYRQWVQKIALGAGLANPLRSRLRLDLELFPHRPQDWARRARLDPLTWDDTVQCIDLGNAEKVLSDALQGIVFVDDKQLWRIEKQRMEPDGEGRVVVRITPLVQQVHPQHDLLGAAA